MIEFSYQRETLPELLGWEYSRDPSLATRGELLWYFFPADIVLRSEGRVIETRHAGIPLLHFVLAMIRIANELLSADSGESHYAFTESDEDLVFIRRGDAAEIRSSFDAAILEFPIAGLRNAVRVLALSVLDELIIEYPSLAESPVIADVITGVEQT